MLKANRKNKKLLIPLFTSTGLKPIGFIQLPQTLFMASISLEPHNLYVDDDRLLADFKDFSS